MKFNHFALILLPLTTLTLANAQDLDNEVDPEKIREISVISQVANNYAQLALSLTDARANGLTCDVGAYKDDIIKTIERAISLDNEYKLSLGLAEKFKADKNMQAELGDDLAYKTIIRRQGEIDISTEGKGVNAETYELFNGTVFHSPAMGAYGSTNKLHLNSKGIAEKVIYDVDTNKWSSTAGFWRLEDKVIEGLKNIVLVTNFGGKRKFYLLTGYSTEGSYKLIEIPARPSKNYEPETFETAPAECDA
jgi:hypothetical protein